MYPFSMGNMKNIADDQVNMLLKQKRTLPLTQADVWSFHFSYKFTRTSTISHI